MRLRTLEVAVPGLPPELDGLRIAHLSDFHLGAPSRGKHAVERAVEWVRERQPDLDRVTGDLLAVPRGEPRLRELVGGCPNCFAILGNHDFAISRDPFSHAARTSATSAGSTLLSDEGVTIEVRGRRVYIAGADPRSRWLAKRKQPADLAVPRGEADLRILLAHYPRLVDQLPPGAFDLVLAGHMHDGQICLPYPGGKLRLAHLGARATTAASTACRAARCTSRPARDDLRPVPVRRAARSDRAGATTGVMEGHAVISSDILARYAADAALEVNGRARPRRRAPLPARRRQVVERRQGSASSCTSRSSGARRSRRSAREVQGAVREYLGRMADANACGRGRRRRGRPTVTRVAGLTGATLETAPTVCHECVWWQSRGGRDGQAALDREGRGRVGRVGHGLLRRRRRLLGSMQYGPARALPARGRAAGRAAVRRRGARHLRVPRRPGDAVGDAVAVSSPRSARRATRARALEAFAYRYPEGETTYERFHVHKTVFPADFLADFGFPGARAGPRRAGAARARRPAAGDGGHAREKVLASRQGGVRAGPVPGAAGLELGAA